MHSFQAEIFYEHMKLRRIAEQVKETEDARIRLLKAVNSHAHIHGLSYTESSFYFLMVKGFVDKHHEELVNLINAEAERDEALRKVVRLKADANAYKYIHWATFTIMSLAIIALTYTR